MASSETKVCQNCQASFVIDASDFAFYEKIGVPPPTWCPMCRNMRRMAWREYRNLYRGSCAMCNKPIITIHAPSSTTPSHEAMAVQGKATEGKPGGPFTVYCRECFRSDKWNPMDYGRDYDFSKPFFTQYRELMEAVPRPALTGSSIVNSEFSHASQGLKNCHNVFWSYYSEDSENCYALLLSRSAFDCYVADNSDHVYECLHSNRLYRVSLGIFSDDCLNSDLLYNCVGCSDCFGSVNLRKQKYCLFNQQLTKEEYKKAREDWDIGSYAKFESAKKKFRELYLSLPHRPAHILSSENVTGDIIRDAKNCQYCFSALDGVENCKYLYLGGLSLKDSMDVSGGGDSSELLYEIFGVSGQCQKVLFSDGCHDCVDTLYSVWLSNCSKAFGCLSLRNKKYCVLNKQYAKEEYEILIQRIRRHMDEMPYVDKRNRTYRFGEFFPAELSAYAYNESFGFPWYPKTKEQVLAEGWRWQDPPQREYKITKSPEDLPDHIRDAEDSILAEIIGCSHAGKCNHECTTAFRISAAELAFHRDMNLALPRICPNCRLSERLSWRNKFDLYHRRCSCQGKSSKLQALLLRQGFEGQASPTSQTSSNIENIKLQTEHRNTTTHFHGENPCPNEFETTFSPDQPEIIYCPDCYRAEFL